MADLLKCPFCGGEASIVTYQGSKSIFYIECKDCNALMGNPRRMTSAMKGKLYFENEAELIEAWNTRKPMKAVVAELETEYDLADKEKARCMRENLLQYDEAKGYARGIDTAIEIVRGKEQGMGKVKYYIRVLGIWFKVTENIFYKCDRLWRKTSIGK